MASALFIDITEAVTLASYNGLVLNFHLLSEGRQAWDSR